MQNLRDYFINTLLLEMKLVGVPRLPPAALEQLLSIGQTVLSFGGLTIKFTILEKDLYSPEKHLTKEEEALVKKYK